MSSEAFSNSPRSGHDPYAALRHANFRNYSAGNACSIIGVQMFNVALGWELYERTNSATALGLVGLFQVLPMFLLTIPGGHLVDRVNRRLLIIFDQLLLAVTAAGLGLASLYHAEIPDLAFLQRANLALSKTALFFGDSSPVFTDRHIPILYLLLLFIGTIRSVNQPAKQAMLPELVPAEVFPNAVTWNSSVFEACTVIGPALGGALLAGILHASPASDWAYPCVYFLTALCILLQVLFYLFIKCHPAPLSKEPISLQSLFAGFRFVYNTKIVFATITLDLFAVLFGGATALLPMIARDVLGVGPFGLGLMRSAPSIGAVLMAFAVAHLPPMRNAGRNMLFAVLAFGLATIGFGMSRSLVISFVMLLLVGAADNISVIVRHTLVQVLTPNEMRGRVSAVNSIFISCSNELGQLESGITAAIFGSLLGSAASGAVLAVVVGGMGTIAVVATIAYLFPEVARFKELVRDQSVE